MSKKYSAPELSFVKMPVCDVITSSTPLNLIDSIDQSIGDEISWGER